MDETDRTVFRSSVYLFIFPTNTIKQLTTLLHICIFIYIMYIYMIDLNILWPSNFFGKYFMAPPINFSFLFKAFL